MGSSFSTKKNSIPKPLPLKTLLSHVKTHMHPLNQYLLTPESRPHVPLVTRSDPQTVRLLTFNICLVPVCFTPLIYAPYQAQRMEQFVLTSL